MSQDGLRSLVASLGFSLVFWVAISWLIVR